MAHQYAVAERSAGTHKPLRAMTFGALSVAGMLALDRHKAKVAQSHRPKDPEFIPRDHSGEQTIVVLPGCRTDGRRIVDLLEPKLSRLGTTVYTAYPQNGFSLESIGQGLLRAREQTGKDRVSVLAFSMGGMVLSRLGADEQFRQAFGPIDTVVLDSSPATYEHVSPKMQHLLEVARVARYSHAMSRLAPQIMAHEESKELADHEAGMDEALLRAHFEARVNAPLDAIAGQGDFMKNCPDVPDGALAGWADTIWYVHAIDDPIVDTRTSSQAYAKMFGQPLHDVTDENRPEANHAGGLEYPSFVASLLEHQLSLAA